MQILRKNLPTFDNWKGSKAALAKWTCPHCSCARLSVMPWVAARWEVAGCGTSCRGPGEWSASKADAQEVDKEEVKGQKLTEKDEKDEKDEEKKDDDDEDEPARRSSRRR